MGGIGSNQYVTKPGGKLKGPRGLPDVTSLALETEWPEDSGWTDEAMDEYAAALEDTRKTRPVSFAESTRRNLSQALGSILDAFHPTS